MISILRPTLRLMMAPSAPGPPQDSARNHFDNFGRREHSSAGPSSAASIQTVMERCIFFLLLIYSTISGVPVIITITGTPPSSATKGKKSVSRPNTHRYSPYKRAQSAGHKSDQAHGAEKKEDDGDDKNAHVGKSKRRRANSDDRPFACPYYKFNPIEHERCLTRNRLTDTAFVVQHLLRGHELQPIHCPVCGDVFGTHAECDGHIQAQSCEGRDFWFEGLTKDQVNSLKGSRRHLNEVERWFCIWDIIFPNIRRPESPYVGSVAEEMIGVYRRALVTLNRQGSLEEVLSRSQAGQDAPQSSGHGDRAIEMRTDFQLLDPGFVQYVMSVIHRQGNLFFLAPDTLAAGYQPLGPAEQQPQPRLQPSRAHQFQLQALDGPSQFHDFQLSPYMAPIQHGLPERYSIPLHVPPAASTSRFQFPVASDAAVSNIWPQGEAPIGLDPYLVNDARTAPYSQGFTTPEVLHSAQSDFSFGLADTLALTEPSSVPFEEGQSSAVPPTQPGQCLGSTEPD